jgi:osmotically-inducible protein OsmY
MKTFFVALILGIFIGAMITAYYNSPEAFESLIPSKTDKTERESDQRQKNLESNDSKPKEEADSAEKSNLKEKASDGAKAIAEKSKDIIESTKDLGIKTAIRGKLKLDKEVDPSRIEIRIQDGSVTLLGEVSSREEARKARDIVLDTRGVKDVSSKLKVVPKEE